MVYDVNTRHMDQIPSLQSSENSFPSDSDCGIHAIEINPSRTLLATGAKNASDVAIYRLPTLDPILVGEVSLGRHCPHISLHMLTQEVSFLGLVDLNLWSWSAGCGSTCIMMNDN